MGSVPSKPTQEVTLQIANESCFPKMIIGDENPPMRVINNKRENKKEKYIVKETDIGIKNTVHVSLNKLPELDQSNRNYQNEKNSTKLNIQNDLYQTELKTKVHEQEINKQLENEIKNNMIARETERNETEMEIKLRKRTHKKEKDRERNEPSEGEEEKQTNKQKKKKRRKKLRKMLKEIKHILKNEKGNKEITTTEEELENEREEREIMYGLKTTHKSTKTDASTTNTSKPEKTIQVTKRRMAMRPSPVNIPSLAIASFIEKQTNEKMVYMPGTSPKPLMCYGSFKFPTQSPRAFSPLSARIDESNIEEKAKEFFRELKTLLLDPNTTEMEVKNLLLNGPILELFKIKHFESAGTPRPISPVMVSQAVEEELQDIQSGRRTPSSVIKSHKTIKFYNEFEEDNQFLHLAARRAMMDVIFILLRIYGLNVNTCDIGQNTSVHFAAHQGHANIVSQLMHNGAEINVKNQNGCTPLHLATEAKDHTDTIDRLIQAGANVNERNNWMSTPLHFATQNNHGKVVQSLISYGANVNLKDKWGEAPIHIATKKSYASIVEQLIQARCKIDVQDREGRTPLFEAMKNQDEILCMMLLRNGADLYHKDRKGRSPIDYTRRPSRYEYIFLTVRRAERMRTEELMNQYRSIQASSSIDEDYVIFEYEFESAIPVLDDDDSDASHLDLISETEQLVSEMDDHFASFFDLKVGEEDSLELDELLNFE